MQVLQPASVTIVQLLLRTMATMAVIRRFVGKQLPRQALATQPVLCWQALTSRVASLFTR